MTIKILQWNINGYFNNYNELSILINNLYPDVICLQETHIPFNNFNIPIPKLYSAHFYNLCTTTSKQGIAFLIKRQIPHSIISNHPHLLSSVLQLNINPPLKLVNCYFPPHISLTVEDLQSTCHGLQPPGIILGDFNGWSPMWGSNHTNSRGRIIENFILSENFILLNNGRATHLSTHNSFSNIDLTLCSTDLHSKCDWEVLEDPHGSDHFPILTKINTQYTFGKSITVKKFKTDQANWGLFSSLCDQKFNSWNFKNINHEVAMITKSIKYAANVSIPQTKGGSTVTRVCWWNDELSHLRSNKLSLWKTFKRSPNTGNLINYKKANAIFKRRVKESKSGSFAKFTSQINLSAPLNLLWKKIHSITRPPHFSIQAIKADNTLFTSPNQICSAFAKKFSEYSMDNNFSPEYYSQKHYALSNLLPSNKICTIARHIEVNLTLLELETALTKSKGKTPGLDRICYPMLKHLSPSAKAKVLNLYNIIFSEGKFPHMWRNAAVVCIPKPNKPTDHIESYRPISLLPCLSKLFEKIIAKRLLWYISHSNKLNPNQIAFRSGQGTIDVLLEFQHAAFDSLSTKNHLSVLSIDFAKAFDRIGIHAVLNRLATWCVGPKIFYAVKDFMMNRKFQVKLQNQLSSPVPLCNGIPQGSPLSVVLFIIAFDEVSNIINKFKGFHHRLYADDLIIYTKTVDLSIVNATFSKIMSDLNTWGVKSGAKIALEKCKTLHICKKINCNFPPVKINNAYITHTNKLSLLGILFDSKLTFKDHCLALRKNLSSRLNIIKHLTCKQAQIHTNTLIDVTRALILSKIDYGLPIYGWCAKSHLQQISTPYHAAIRMCLSAFRTSPISCILIEAGMPHISDRVRTSTFKLIGKFFNSRNILLRRTYSKAATNIRSYHLLSTLRRCVIFCRNAGTPTLLPRLPYSPAWWLLNPSTFILNLHSFPKHSTPEETYLRLFYQTIHRYRQKGWDFIYTDGSKKGNICTFAIVSSSSNFVLGGWLLPSTSIFTAEIMAVKLAADLALESATNTIICTDSLAAVEAIRSPSNNNSITSYIKSILIHHPQRLKVLWVPSHVGIPGNESADKIARSLSSSPMHTFLTHESNDIRRQILLYLKNNKSPPSIDPNHHYYKFNPQLTPVRFPIGTTRMQARIFSRLRIGHTSLSHAYLLNSSNSAICPLCGTIADPLHIIDQCHYLSNHRNHLFPDALPSTLLSAPSIENIRRIYSFLHTHRLTHFI